MLVQIPQCDCLTNYNLIQNRDIHYLTRLKEKAWFFAGKLQKVLNSCRNSIALYESCTAPTCVANNKRDAQFIAT